MQFLTPAEVATLADAIASRCRALVLVGAYGGLRIGELAGLRRRRVDLLRGTVTVAEMVVEVWGCCTWGRPRPGPAGARSGCPGLWSRSWPSTLPAQATRRASCSRAPRGGPLRVTAFRARVWPPAVMAAGLDGLCIHDLRHTAVAVVDRGRANPREVSARGRAFLGALTLDRYRHLYPEADTALRDRLDALYGTTRPAPASSVVRLPRRAGRGPRRPWG
jgi:integrase